MGRFEKPSGVSDEERRKRFTSRSSATTNIAKPLPLLPTSARDSMPSPCASVRSWPW
jgi:hypothetical protein